jgi:hypothetical protein
MQDPQGNPNADQESYKKVNLIRICDLRVLTF